MTKFFKSYKKDAGTDIVMSETVTLKAKEMTDVPLRVNVNPPRRHLAIVCPRSSYAMKGIFIANCPIDSGYTGNIRAIVYNSSNEDIVVHQGERFCQFIVLKCKPNILGIKNNFNKRKNRGWGSTGK